MRCTVGQLQDFKSSAFWSDACEELDIWIEEIRSQLENPDLEFDHRTLDQLGGNAKALRSVKMLPDVLIAIAEENRELRDEIMKELSP